MQPDENIVSNRCRKTSYLLWYHKDISIIVIFYQELSIIKIEGHIYTVFISSKFIEQTLFTFNTTIHDIVTLVILNPVLLCE